MKVKTIRCVVNYVVLCATLTRRNDVVNKRGGDVVVKGHMRIVWIPKEAYACGQGVGGVENFKLCVVRTLWMAPLLVIVGRYTMFEYTYLSLLRGYSHAALM